MQKTDDCTLEERFKSLAVRLKTRAYSEKAGVARAELQRLAECYVALAEEEKPRRHFKKS